MFQTDWIINKRQRNEYSNDNLLFKYLTKKLIILGIYYNCILYYIL